MSMFGGIPVESSAPPSAGGSMFGGIPLDKPQPPQTDPGLGRTALDQSLQGASFGFADEATDALGALGTRAVTAYKNNAPKLLGGDPGAYDGESLAGTMQDARAASKARMQQEWQQHPVASIASNVAGGLATGKIMGATNAGKALGSSIGSGEIFGKDLGLAGRAIKSAAAGAASGGIYGAGAADDGNRLEGAEQGAKYGAAFGAAAPVVGAVASNVASGAKTAWKGAFASGAQELDEAGNVLKKVATDAYQDMRNAGAELNRSGISKVTYKIGKELSDSGLMNEDLHRGTLSVIKDLNADAQSGSLTLEKLDQYRQLLGQVIKKNTTKLDGMNPDAFKATQAISALDDAVETIGAAHLSKGTPQAIQTLDKARAAWSQYSKFDRISGIIQAAEGDANKIKQGLKTFLKNTNNTRGFSGDEIKALENAANRTGGEKILRGLGTFGFDLGKTKNIALPAIATGSSTLVPGGIPLVAAGTAARQTGKYLARGKAEQLLNVIQNGGQAAQSAVPTVSGLMPSMMGGQAGGRIGAPQPQMPVMPTQAAPMQMPPQVNTQPPSAPQQIGNALLDRISQVESGGNPNAQASTSSASGEYQFTDPTWKAMVAKHPEAGMTVADKGNSDAQKKMAELLLQDNTQSLQSSLGRKPSDGELYMAHFLGAGDAAKLIKNANSNVPAASLFPKEASANKNIFYHNGQPLTTGQVYAKLLSKVEG